MPFNINEFLNSTQEISAGPFRWEAKTFKIVEVSRDKIRITGVAVHAGETSKNQNRYVREALIKATNTWIGKPLIVNHKANEVVGNVELMDFDEETNNLNYTALVNKQPLVNMIRDKSTAVRGVSIGADYLAIKCSKCGGKFQTEEEWYNHATNQEYMRNLPREPHGIIGKDLSLVLAPEIPGCNTTVGIAETAPHMMGLEELFNMVISESGNKSKKQMTEQTNKIEEAKVEVKPLPKTTQIREALTIPKVVYEEEECTPFEQCIKDGGSPEECKLKFIETQKRNSNNKALFETVNKIVEALNQPVTAPADDTSWIDRIDSLQKNIENRLTSVASEIVSVTNKWNSELAKVSESIGSIKPYDDSALKEMIAAIPKDDLGWKELKIPEAYNDAPIKEIIAKATKDFETVLAVADKNIAETRKTLEERIKELTDKNIKLTETVQTQEKKLQETATLTENTADKLEPKFKGKAGKDLDQIGIPNKVKPYS
jgi:hypothetical protein